MRKNGLNIKNIAVALIVLAVNIMNVKADSALAFFRHITVEEGLSSNQVRSLMQDSKGFIWVGTDQGLNRYDGYNVKVYPFPGKYKGTTLLSLYENESVIWIGTDDGLFLFDMLTETISQSTLATEDGISITGEVNSICKDKDGNIWLSTYGQGIFRYEPAVDQLKHFPFEHMDGKLSMVYVDRLNQIWALTNWGSPILSRLNKATDKFEEFLLDFQSPEVTKGGLVIMEDSNQRFWLGSWDMGLYEVDRLTGRIFRRLSSEEAGLSHIHSVIEYEPDRLLIGSDDGLLMYDTLKNKYWNHTMGNPFSDNGALSSRFVYPLMKDRESSLWVGTYYGGVNFHSPFSKMFDCHVSNPFDPDAVKGNIFGRFCEDSEQNIWIASDDAGLTCYETRTGKYRNYRNIPGKNSLSYDNVHALCMDGYDLWIGTYTGGVNVLDTRTGRFRFYYPEEGNPDSIDGTSSYAIFKDHDGRIWIATINGINLYDRENDKFIRKRGVRSQIIDIDQDADGNMWFSTQGDGLIRYDDSKDLWSEYTFSDTEGCIPGDYVNCGFLDARGKMWFGTNSGLCWYDSEKDAFVVSEIPEYLSNVSGIVGDQNILWLTTNHGLVRYDINGGTHVFSTSNGLCSNQFVNNSIFKASDGRIYLGTTKGFNSFYPYQVKTNKVLPEVALLSVAVDNEMRKTGISDTGVRRVVMSHRNRTLTLHYSSLSYCASYKNQYAYMLEGFDSDWNYVGNTSQATYTNLPAGTYTFLVKGTNNDAMWGEECQCLELVVKPHPLLSTSFKVIYMIVAALLLLLIVVLTSRINDKKHEKEIDDLEKRKEKEVYESKIGFFTMIAHEIRTPLSLIIGPLEKILKKTDKLPDQVVEDIKTMERNTQRLLYLVNQLLDFRKVEQASMVMRFVNQPIEPLLRSVCERFKPSINYNGAEIEVIYPSRPLTVSVDTEALTKLISNLLTNASKYTNNLVRVSCDLCAADERYFTISVYDNGCGISPEEQSKIFLPFYQTLENKPGTGIGLSLVKSIAELHRGRVSIKSEVGVFSEFTVMLPVNQENCAADRNLALADQPIKKTNLEDILNMDEVIVSSADKPMILIVDDNDEIVKFLFDTLSNQYNIITASDGVEAWELIQENPNLSLVIADWMMPKLDGISLCKSLRENVSTSHIPFVLLTAKTDDASKVAGMDCGADVYIEKPFSIQYLDACLRNLIAMRDTLKRRYTSSPLIPLMSVANNSLDGRFLQTLNTLIETHMSDSNLSVEFLTEQMGVSRSSFYNKIKSLTDSTPNELIQLMRLKRAAQLLSEHKYRINEICYMVGFNNPSYFSKCFAKQFGMKPGEFAAKSE